MAFRNTDDERIFGALRLVVVLELESEPQSLITYHCIGLWIVVWRAAEDGYRDRRFLQLVRLALERCLNHEIQKLEELLGGAHRPAALNAFERTPNI